MSCCPAVPPIKVASGFPEEPSMGNPPARVEGESEDCYQKRVANQSASGEVGDKPEPAPDKIKQNAIAPNATETECTVNITFTTTIVNHTPTSWQFVKPDDSPIAIAGITFDTTAGTMIGTFAPADYGKKFMLRVKVFDGAVKFDDRTYTFSPALGSKTNTMKFAHPLPGAVVTSKFGPRKPPVTGASSEHGGVDFASRKPGSKVLCAADGTVTLCRPGKGYGNYVIVQHTNGSGKFLISTLYAHLDSFAVSLGDKVLTGQPIGIEGNTGHGSGKHLHFEARLPNGTKVDPLPYIDGSIQVAESNAPPEAAVPDDGHKGTVTPEDVAARSDC